MADPVTIAQTGVDPVTGSYLSAERRKAIFKTTRVSAFGGGGGGNVEPQTSAIVKRQENEIVQLKKEINTIQKAQTAAATTFQQTISGIQSFIGVVGVNVKDLGSRILGVNNLLTADSNLEIQKDRQEQLQEKKLAEEGARSAKESQLEQRIQQTMLAPVRSVINRTQGIFDRLMKALTAFFLGWLTNKILNTIQSESGKTTNIFKSIFDAVIGGVTYFAKTLWFINRTLSAIGKIIFGTTKLLAKFLVSGIGGLFRGLGKLAGGIVDAGKNLLGIGTKTAETAAEASAKVAAKESGGMLGGFMRMLGIGAREGGEVAAKGLGKGLGKLVPGVGAAIGAYSAYQNVKEGDLTGAFLDVGSMLPIVGLPFLAGSLIYETNQALTQSKDSEAKPSASRPAEKTQPSSSVKPLSPAVPKPTTQAPAQVKSQPSAQVVPSMADFQFGVDTTGQMDFNKPAESGEVSIQPTQGTVSPDTKPTAQITPAQTQRVPTPAVKVGPEPEQKPNIVMMSSISPQSQMTSTVLKSSGSAASDVPAIKSSNPDNFYILYSQVNYNVLI